MCDIRVEVQTTACGEQKCGRKKDTTVDCVMSFSSASAEHI